MEKNLSKIFALKYYFCIKVLFLLPLHCVVFSMSMTSFKKYIQEKKNFHMDEEFNLFILLETVFQITMFICP